MSDTQNTPPADDQPGTDPADNGTPEPQGTEDSTDWKAEARKWERRAKEAASLKEAADKWREYERSQKPEQERIAEELNEARTAAQAAQAALTRYEVAAEKGITGDAVKLLTGSTKEELEASADLLLTLIGNQPPKGPKPDPNQGAGKGGGTSTAAQFAAAIDDIL